MVSSIIIAKISRTVLILLHCSSNNNAVLYQEESEKKFSVIVAYSINNLIIKQLLVQPQIHYHDMLKYEVTTKKSLLNVSLQATLGST